MVFVERMCHLVGEMLLGSDTSEVEQEFAKALQQFEKKEKNKTSLSFIIFCDIYSMIFPNPTKIQQHV